MGNGAWQNVTLLEEDPSEAADLGDIVRAVRGDHRSAPRGNGEHRRRRSSNTSDGYDELDFA